MNGQVAWSRIGSSTAPTFDRLGVGAGPCLFLQDTLVGALTDCIRTLMPLHTAHCTLHSAPSPNLAPLLQCRSSARLDLPTVCGACTVTQLRLCAGVA